MKPIVVRMAILQKMTPSMGFYISLAAEPLRHLCLVWRTTARYRYRYRKSGTEPHTEPQT